MKQTEVHIKKTEKIISNKPVDKDEFSYFKKDPAKKEEKPKPRIETEEDLNLFKTSTNNNKAPSKPIANEDEFDFDF